MYVKIFSRRTSSTSPLDSIAVTQRKILWAWTKRNGQPDRDLDGKKWYWLIKSNIKVDNQSLQLKVIVLVMLVTITLGLLVAFILKESAAELAPLPEEFFFVFSLYPHLVHLLSLPSFAPLSCPSLEQFPVQLEQSRELLAGLVEDETGQTRLIVNGFGYKYGCCDQFNSLGWWLWRNGNWETTTNISIPRFSNSNHLW